MRRSSASLPAALPTATDTVSNCTETRSGQPISPVYWPASSTLIKVNYDSGNSSSLGFVPEDEFGAYGHRIGSVHIKDRVRGGGDSAARTGDADLSRCVCPIWKKLPIKATSHCKLPFRTGQEVAWARSNREFVARYWPLNNYVDLGLTDKVIFVAVPPAA